MKVYSATVINALGESLRCAYWYKQDLRSFIERAGVPADVIGQLDWNENKREIVRRLLDGLVRQADAGTKIISDLLDAVVEQDDFDHLAQLEDGNRKVQDAQAAVIRLKELLGRESVAQRAARAKQESRTESERRKAAAASRQDALRGLGDEFNRLVAAQDEQARGLAFEDFLRRLFALHDLDPRGGFSAPGEQTDGSIRLDNQLFLVEARWRTDPASPSDVRSFRGKVEEKLDNTLGIFIAMNGFTDEAVKRAAVPPAKIILLDGVDLAPVVQGARDLVEMLRRKVRRAAETGDVLFRVAT